MEGIVQSLGAGAPRPAAGVTISLDDFPSVLTDDDGRFRLADVPVGSHRTSLSLRELPADYDPGPRFEIPVQVGPGRTTAVALEVWRLGSIQGFVASSDANCRENVKVGLQPSGRLTVSDVDGAFSFANLREGEYEVAVEGAVGFTCVPVGSTSHSRKVRADTATPLVEFQLRSVAPAKPVRRVELDPG